jgi:heparosan-N-sulfate-glucuronate 5-epimerase
MGEGVRKATLYISPLETYWRRVPRADQAAPSGARLGIYPVSMAQRIHEGHHAYFDAAGIPMWPDASGTLRPHLTTTTSFALGQWELWLLTGEHGHRDRVLTVADFLLGLANSAASGGAMFLDHDDTEGGTACAMNQGEAISVLCRAHELTGSATYLDLAIRSALPFHSRYGPDGVTGSVNGAPWYLEGGKTILNGHIYALFGLHDLACLTGDAEHAFLFEQGARSVAESVTLFDAGFWSWYWLESPPYAASMMYHNLHVVQLEALTELFDDGRLRASAQRFRAYARSPANRLKAGLTLATGKLRRRWAT